MLRSPASQTCILIACLLAGTAFAQSPVTVTLNLNSPGPAIPDHFIGLSYETAHVLPDANGVHYFSPSNTALIKTFQTLGVKSLRVGGNAADAGPIPSDADADSLFAFAQAAGVDVIYTLKLKNSSAAANAAVAGHIVTADGASLVCFVVGNEPSFFVSSFSTYESDVKKYMAAINPRANFCGADVEDGGRWASEFANAFVGFHNVTLITQHHYLGSGTTNGGATGRNVLLSPNALSGYAKLRNGFAATVAKDGFTYRLSETNSFFHGGAAGASNTFASALWGLDYLHWWAAHGAAGLNFHTGDTVLVGGGTTLAPAYAVFVTSKPGQHVHPLGYGVKAFDVGSHGAVIPVTLTNSAGINLTAYGVLAGPNDLFVTLINKEHDTGARAATVTVVTNSSFTRGQVMLLAAPNGNVAVTNGVTLGGAAINDDGSWAGTFSALPPPSSGEFTVNLPAATAAVLHLQ
jgi:hypothetical protein